LGDAARAIDHYTRAHDEINAARLLEREGRDREAGRLLERALDLAAEHERAPLQLALGRILARRGAYADAARLLQASRNSEEHRTEAKRHLIAVLATRCSSCARAIRRCRRIWIRICARGAIKRPSARRVAATAR
jgi:tetratricopeptide (TPR) repeat protein